MSIQAVFFDMGGTIERLSASRELRLQATPALQELLRSVGIHLPLTSEQLYEVVMQGWKRYHAWAIETEEELAPVRVWQEYILAGYPATHVALEAHAEDLMVFLEMNYYQREMRPEMPQVLEAIKAMGLKIGLISNVCSLGQVCLSLEKYGIRHYFDPIILSSEYGRRKPDPSIFHQAARLANAPTSQCVYIGDRIARDILGARRAGFRLAVQICHDYDHGEADRGAKPDAVITQMTELLPIIQAEQAAPPAASQCAILFDAGDILYHRPHRGAYLREFLAESGLTGRQIPPAEREALKRQVYHGLITQEQHREALLRLYGITDPALMARGKEAMCQDDNNIEFFEGVAATLKKLKALGYLLGIITDTAMPVHVKLDWFESGGFGQVWDSIISSADIGVQKPNPLIYQAALTQLGVSASQAIFVGHDCAELDGAHALGMFTIAFNADPNAQADVYVDQFPDLVQQVTLAQHRVGQAGLA